MKLDIEKLKELLEKATKGPWEYSTSCQTVDGGEGGGVLVCQASDNDTGAYDWNGKLIAAAVNSLPALIAEVERLRELEANPRDEYHTMEELYDHRHGLFLALMITFNHVAWKSMKHSDGTMFDGFFIAGIKFPTGTITYHLPLEHWRIAVCKELANAPEWDGHTSQDVVRRLLSFCFEVDMNPNLLKLYSLDPALREQFGMPLPPAPVSEGDA